VSDATGAARLGRAAATGDTVRSRGLPAPRPRGSGRHRPGV